MIYVTGDCHGVFSKFSSHSFLDQKDMTKDDYVIICGDFGIWTDDTQERHWLDWLNEKNFTTLFIDGNHENFDRLYSDEFEVVDFHGGKAHKIRDSVYHLMRGYVFQLCGKKIFAFGGARSHDISDGILDRADYKTKELFNKTMQDYVRAGKMFRVNHVSWWAEEMPSNEEMERGIQSLIEHDDKVDFVITHCCPQEVASYMGYLEPDILTQYFNTIASNTEFTRWYFGHYHGNRDVLGKYTMLYDKIERIC